MTYLPTTQSSKGESIDPQL